MSANNVTATRESGEPIHAGSGGGKSVWWTWTPSRSGIATINTFGSSFDTVLAVYTGNSVSSLSPVAYGSNDNFQGSPQSQVTFTVTAGRAYQIAVDGFHGASGNIILRVTAPTIAGPANDNFANRVVITNTSGTFTGSNVGATRQNGEPIHAGYGGGKSVWWTWTPSSSGTAVISTFGSSFDTVLAVYTGSSVANLSLVPYGSNDDVGSSPQSQVTIYVVAGTPYQIAVDGYQGASGSIRLRVVAPPIVWFPATNSAGRSAALTTAGTAGGNSLVATGVSASARISSSASVSANTTGFRLLANGHALSELAGAQGSATYCQLNVPAGQSVLSVKMSGGSGDCDLYVRYAALPTLAAYNARPHLRGNLELATLPAPASGAWFILLYGASAYSGVTLQVEYSQEETAASH